jgi:hypothetical protein
MKRFTSAVLIFIFVMGFLGGCNSNPASAATRDFTKEGMTITLTANFREQRGSETERFTFAYHSERDSVMVTAIKEDFKKFEEAGVSTSISLKDYAQIVINANNLNSRIEEKDGLTYFIYSSVGNSYFSVVYRGPDAYWLVQFATDTNKFDSLVDTFAAWAKTVTIEQTSISRIRDIIDDVIADLNKPENKEFSGEGFKITLTEHFIDFSSEEGFENMYASFGSENDMAFVFVSREYFTTIINAGFSTDRPLTEYAQLVIDVHRRDSSVSEADGLTFFEYKHDNNSYLAAVYKGNDSFWIFTFSCRTANYEGLLDNFKEWAKTVRV